MAMNNDLLAIVTFIERERGVDREIVLVAIEQAIQQAARRNPGVTNDLRVAIDRKTLTVYGTYALEGINEIYPRPTDAYINVVTPKTDEREIVHTLQGVRLNGMPATKGVYIVNGRKQMRY